MWNNSKSPIRYTWEKISHCHIIEVEPCEGVIGTSPVWGCSLPGDGYRGHPGGRAVRASLGLEGDCPRAPISPPEPNEVGDFELNLTGGVPGPTIQDLQCEIQDSPCPVVLHIEAAFKVLGHGGPGSWECLERLGGGREAGPGLLKAFGK